jgi:AcrR family transcriptional regulator
MDKEKTDKKDHILDVAERVFSELGYDGASTRTISGEAGVNMAMLNYYFGSKEGLFLAIFERRISVFQNLLQYIGSDDKLNSWQKVEYYIEAYVDRIFSNSCFQRLLYQEMSMTKRGELSDKLNRIIMNNVIEFRKILQEGIDRNEFKKDADTDLLIATIHGVKNFIMNTSGVSSLMLGFDIQNPDILENNLKPRLKTYMKNLLKAYLVN